MIPERPPDSSRRAGGKRPSSRPLGRPREKGPPRWWMFNNYTARFWKFLAANAQSKIDADIAC
jgi:hypothetical protein